MAWLNWLTAFCWPRKIAGALLQGRYRSRFAHQGFWRFPVARLARFSWSGTALVGVLDPFWGEKGYVSPAEYNRFCNSTVPLARMKKLIFTNNETFEAAVEVAHYGDGPIAASTPEWKITDQTGKLIQSGKFAQTNIPLGNGFKLGDVSFPLSSITTPEMLKLDVTVNGLSNSWDFWVYPATKQAISGEENIRVVQKLDAQTAQFRKMAVQYC